MSKSSALSISVLSSFEMQLINGALFLNENLNADKRQLVG